jgi:hypothetical protein
VNNRTLWLSTSEVNCRLVDDFENVPWEIERPVGDTPDAPLRGWKAVGCLNGPCGARSYQASTVGRCVDSLETTVAALDPGLTNRLARGAI